ncbi:hypothetical protein A6770_25730 [Nostoc minutum NIES-26]|uniref:Uncharacterized protein n=1 Tax=Nostoc minutum NIES-26 TaxID=1844469 RepID=A0A367QW30_9NOSO|nr:hypothetical protein A6770_25730 [Nostoc minutum NIES-26]
MGGLPNNRAPQIGQKPRLTMLPRSPVTSYYFTSPVIVTALDGTRSAAANALPVARWQSRQWQFPIAIGSAEHS